MPSTGLSGCALPEDEVVPVGNGIAAEEFINELVSTKCCDKPDGCSGRTRGSFSSLLDPDSITVLVPPTDLLFAFGVFGG
jgi:hypothetical protein